MTNLKKFVGEIAYNIIKNITVDNDAIHKALVTPQNARAVFSDLTEYEIKALCSEISNSGKIGQTRPSTQEEITKAFNSVGYDKVIFDGEDEILECKKYYQSNEKICTYNDLKSRMRDYHMLVVVKENIDKIERSKNPRREDEYGTSILNIQVARNGSHMSIKNRYNHTVSEPDSTLNNNLDVLYDGLQSMVLGYYGFASLNSKKSYYKNIVEIGGVYLKYHTEKNNIYFGAFVLDGVNGVRFSDASRYYVTDGKSVNDRYYYNPLVLDFQNKKAIDVLSTEKEINGKALLLTKALEKGILTSVNKIEADTITAIFQNANKELLLINKKSLQYLHDVYGHDFTKPYKVTGLLGKFTAKSIEKITGSDTGMLLMFTQNELKVCELNNGRFNAKDTKRGGYKYNINTFYGQGDFENKRKNGDSAVYVVQQEKQYIGKPKPEERPSYYYGQNTRNQEFDKSGCNVTEAREILNRKLDQYKKDKRAIEAASVDYTQDVLEITTLFNDFKTEIITRLTKAEKSEDYSVFNDVVSYKLTWLVRDIEDIKTHVAHNDFTSIESAQTMINNAKDTIAKLKVKLA